MVNSCTTRFLIAILFHIWMQLVVTMWWLQLHFLFRKLDDPVDFASGSLLDFWTNAVETFHISSAVSSLVNNRNALYHLCAVTYNKTALTLVFTRKGCTLYPFKGWAQVILSQSARLGVETLFPGGAHDQILWSNQSGPAVWIALGYPLEEETGLSSYVCCLDLR